jgi:hypothetical protein
VLPVSATTRMATAVRASRREAAIVGRWDWVGLV